MGRGVPQVDLDGQLDVSLPNGETYRLRPGPYGKGIAVIPLEKGQDRRSAATNGRGRKPRAGTLALRERLEEDHDQGGIAEPKQYVHWLMRIDPSISITVARQVVYRERRRFL